MKKGKKTVAKKVTVKRKASPAKVVKRISTDVLIADFIKRIEAI